MNPGCHGLCKNVPRQPPPIRGVTVEQVKQAPASGIAGLKPWVLCQNGACKPRICCSNCVGADSSISSSPGYVHVSTRLNTWVLAHLPKKQATDQDLCKTRFKPWYSTAVAKARAQCKKSQFSMASHGESQFGSFFQPFLVIAYTLSLRSQTCEMCPNGVVLCLTSTFCVIPSCMSSHPAPTKPFDSYLPPRRSWYHSSSSRTYH